MDRRAAERFSFRTAGPDEVEEFWRTVLGSRVVFDRAGWGGGQYRLDTVRFGGISTGRQRVELSLTGYEASSDRYMAWVNTHGRTVYQRGGEHYASDPSHVLTYRPGVVHRVVHVDAGTELTYLAMERWVLERHLEDLLERPVTGPIALAPMTKLRQGPEQGWWSLLQVFNQMMLSPDSGLVHPAVVDPLCEAMMTCLLLGVDHQYRDALARPARPSRSRPVRQVVEAIHAHPEQPYTVAGLASLAGVSVRSLQAGFRTHLGTSPMAYLRQVRLTRAHEELLSDDTVSVAEVAHRWGFTHLGRFAAEYARQYGDSPSRARHRGRRSA